MTSYAAALSVALVLATAPQASATVDQAAPASFPGQPDMSETDRTALASLEAEAIAFSEQGRFEEADARIAALLVIEERVYGPDHPLTANSHAFRGWLAESRSDMVVGEGHRRRELAIREQVGEAEALASSRLGLGVNLVGQQRYAEAEPFLTAALGFYEASVGITDDLRISAAFNLARSLSMLDRREDAVRVLEPINVALASTAEDGPLAALVANELGFTLFDLGRNAEAEGPARRACELWSGAAPGPGVWAGAACMTAAEVLIALGREDEANPLLRRALATDEGRGPLTPSRQSAALDALIRIEEAAGDRAGIESLLRASVEARRAAWGDDSLSAAWAMNRLGLWLAAHDRVDEAVEQHLRARDLYAAVEGPASSGVLTTTNNAAVALARAPGNEQALALTTAALEALGDAPEGGETPQSAETLILLHGQLLSRAGRAEEGREAVLPVAAAREARGAGPEALIAVYGVLADASVNLHDLEGVVHYRRLLLDQQRLLDDPRQLAMRMARYGQALIEIEDLQTGYEHLGQALEILTDMDGAAREDRLYVMQHMGDAAYRMGRLDQAEILFSAVLAARREAPDNAAALGVALSLYGRLRVEQNRFPEAEAFYREELALAEAHADDYAASIAYSNLGELWRFQGRLEEAEAALRRVIDYNAQRYGPEHIQNVFPLKNLAVHLSSTGREERALDLLMQALAIERRSLGPDSPRVLRTQVSIAQTLGDLGRLEEAERMFMEVLETALARLEGAHPVTINAATQLGFILTRRGALDDAARLLEMAAALTERAYGPDSHQMINVLQLWSFALYQGRDYAQNLEIMTRTEALVDAVGGRWPRTVVDVKANLGRTYIEAGRAADALEPLREAAVLAVTLSREQAVAAGARAQISRAPFRTLVEAAWRVAEPR